MGDKARAKALAREAGVPVVPGVEGEDVSLEQARAFAAEHGYPVVIKAVAGGGGKGMRAVHDAGELEAAVASARREAKAAFGDEPRARRALPRAAAPHRDPGAGRRPRRGRAPRRARVLAAAPPPEGDRGGAVAGRRTTTLRARMGEAAVALARACGYAGAGHRRVHRARRRVRVLLPGDEHAPAGRAPGDRARLRRRPRRAAAARGGGRAAGSASRRRWCRAATRSRRGCTPRTRPTASCPRSARCAATCEPRRGRGWTPASARAASSARTTTRCWPR